VAIPTATSSDPHLQTIFGVILRRPFGRPPDPCDGANSGRSSSRLLHRGNRWTWGRIRQPSLRGRWQHPAKLKIPSSREFPLQLGNRASPQSVPKKTQRETYLWFQRKSPPLWLPRTGRNRQTDRGWDSGKIRGAAMARGRSRLRVAVRALAKVRDRTSVMWAFVEDLYREYCLARLQEMRKYGLWR
jgi:hypothetical protein